MNKQRAVGILVSYYPKYKEKSILYLQKILLKISTDIKIIVVYNAPEAESEVTTSDSFVDFSMSGSNLGWEFSAWDEALKEIKNHVNFNDDDVLVFANDTFCHHWPFSQLNVNLISDAFKRAKPKQVVGDIKRFKEDIVVNGVRSTMWLASYLFSSRYSDVGHLLPFDKVNADIDFKNSLEIKDRKISFGNSNLYVQERLTNRLFPKDKNKGWYNSEVNDSDLIKSKAFAIINEFLMSAKAADTGAKLVPFYQKKWMRSLGRLRRKNNWLVVFLLQKFKL